MKNKRKKKKKITGDPLGARYASEGNEKTCFRILNG